MDLITNTWWYYLKSELCSQNTSLIVKDQNWCYKKCKILGSFLSGRVVLSVAKNTLFAFFGVSFFEVRDAKCELNLTLLGKISLNSSDTGWTWCQVLDNEKMQASTLAWGAQIQWRNSRCRRWTGLGIFILYYQGLRYIIYIFRIFNIYIILSKYTIYV